MYIILVNNDSGTPGRAAASRGAPEQDKKIITREASTK